MSIIQDKLPSDFLRSNGSMDSNFGGGMIMFSHLPPVSSFTRLSAHSVMPHLPSPEDLILKKERNSPDCSLDSHGGLMASAGLDGYVHTMGIKQEKLSEQDYHFPLYPGVLGKSAELLEVTVGNNQGLLVHDLNMANPPSQLGKEPTGSKGRRSNGDGQPGKRRRKRSEAKQAMILDGDGGSLSPGNKPHICEHCSASFRSSYHLRRHVLIHTGERPFQCSQCSMSFIQKYLLQRHEKIHSGEKPFSCDQCNMRFIQKYHMERHKRTHSGEKPYRCETCQQYFSRTDRLLKHKRTCGDAMKNPGMMDLAFGDGSYGITQGTTGRKRRSKNTGEGGERKRKKGGQAGAKTAHLQDPASGGYSLHEYTTQNQTVSSSTEPGPSSLLHGGHHGHAPKMAFKKANRKNSAKGAAGGAKESSLAPGGVLADLDLMQGAKVGSTSNTYDDAMQFIKKRRYLHAVSNANPSGAAAAVGTSGEYDVGHMPSQQPVVSGVLDGDAPPGLTDEVLQSLLDHYTQKPNGSHHDAHFYIGDHHAELNPASAADLSHNGDAPSPSGDKMVMMHEYSRFLLQALERTSHSFPAGPSPAFTSAQSGNPLFSDKSVYATSPLECGFGPPAASPSPSLPSTMPKSHFVMLTSTSPPPQQQQHGFHLSGLEPAAAHQQLTPSQELSEQMEKPHSSSSSTPPAAYQISPSDLSSRKEPPPPPQDLAPLDASKASYQIENFAQAFGSQFKSDGRGLPPYGADARGEVDHQIRTPVSEFSGFSSLLSDVNEPVSTGSKTTTSQSFR